MGNKKAASYMVNNEMELINTNIVLGNEGYYLNQEHKELLSKIEEAEEKIINKIAKFNNKKGFEMVMLSPKKGRSTL